MSLRMSEVYTSIQGEGLRVGRPTQFIRFAGCNLRCPEWPCDSQHAIDPKRFRGDWTSTTPQGLFDDLPKWPKNLCLTGGEPFLQQLDELEEFVTLATEWGYEVEMFTNGTFEIPDRKLFPVKYTMDWKLPGSGEDPHDETRIHNLKILRKGDAIKFVCADWSDYYLAQTLVAEYMPKLKWGRQRQLEIYVGVVWGKLDPSKLVSWMLSDNLDWKLNIQTHNYIWPPNERGR